MELLVLNVDLPTLRFLIMGDYYLKSYYLGILLLAAQSNPN